MSSDEFERLQRRLDADHAEDVVPTASPQALDGEKYRNDANDDNHEESARNPQPTNAQSSNMGHNNDDLNQLLQFILHENRRRDELMEKMMSRMVPPSASPQISPLSQSTAYHIMPDLSKSISTFDGEGSGSKAREWFNNLKSMQRLHNWPDSFALEAAKANLRSGALHWFNSRAEQLTDWENFKSAFQKTFISTESLTVKWKQMNERVQQKGESVSCYFHEKVKLCHDLNLDFRDTKEQILVGLWSKELCSVVAAMRHDDPDDLLHDILTQEKLHHQRYERIKANKITVHQTERKVIDRPKFDSDKKHNIKEEKETMTRHVYSRPELERRLPARNTEGKPLCFKCKRYGHVSKYCLSDHQSPENATTNNTTATNPSAAVLTNTNVNRKEIDNLKYFQEATINGQPIKAYVDLGSQCVMLRLSEADELNLKYTELESPICIKGFGDGKINPVGKLNAKITVDQATATTEIYIVPDHCQQVPLLIGQPFTEQAHIVIVRRGNTLRIFKEASQNEKEDDCLKNLKIPELPQIKTNLWAKDSCVIPPNHVGFVGVYAEDHKEGDLYIETQIANDRCIPRCVITLDSQGQAEIPIVNITGKDIVLDKDEKLMKGEPCYEETIVEVRTNEVTKNEETKLKTEQININKNIPEDVKTSLVDLLREFDDCFAANLNELGSSSEIECVIETVTNEPVTFRPYRLSHSERQKVLEMVEELKSAGIIIDSTSSYASPILVVKKKTGEERLCIDYRALNKVTKTMIYPLPLIDDQLDRLSGKKYFTTLDMYSGYYQVPVKQCSQHKTAFVTPDGLYEFTKMPFGLVNGPAIFQKMINAVLGPLRFTIAMAYMDDIL